MASTSIQQNQISIQPWLPLKSDGQLYLLKSFFNTDVTVYEIILYRESDAEIWREMIDTETFQDKWQKHNPNIESSLANCLLHVQSCLEDCRKQSLTGDGVHEYSKLSIFGESNSMRLLLKTKLKGKIPFTWNFVFVKCPTLLTKEILLGPLFAMVKELDRRQVELCSIIEAKDKEIEDYRDQGHVTTRKNLTTLPFRKAGFVAKRFADSNSLETCSSVSAEAIALPNISELYQNVMKQKQCREEEKVGLQSPTFESATLRGQTFSTHTQSLAVDTRDADVEKPLEVVSTSVTSAVDGKDEERLRREAIRKRLEDEEQRRKKKKRKINI